MGRGEAGAGGAEWGEGAAAANEGTELWGTRTAEKRGAP